jgi:1,4-alpha-glucan branching enzyme
MFWCAYGFNDLHRERRIFMAAVELVKKMKGPSGKAAIVQEVEFTFHAPEAKKIFIAGAFNDWNTKSMPMKKGKNGTWRVSIKLPPGRYEYKYLVDGVWAENPPGTDTAPNSFGTYNRVVSVN